MSKERAYGSGISQEKATKYVVIGIILAVGFGTLILISGSLADTTNITAWHTYEDAINQDNLDKGIIGYSEWQARDKEILRTTQWMAEQKLYLGSIGKIGMNLGLILVIIGFIGFATNGQLDENTRRTCIILAGVIAVLLLINFVGTLNLSIS